MKKMTATIIIAALTISISACSPAETAPITPVTPANETADIAEEATVPVGAFTFTPENMPRIDGSTATIPLIEAVYSVTLGITRDDAERMTIVSGTDNAYENLLWDGTDILLVYSPSPHILQIAKDIGTELEMAAIGRDALVFLVNAANPVETLTPEQIVSIYSGETRNWKDVGGEDVPISAFQRPYRSGSQTMMDELVMKGTPMMDTEAEYVIGQMGGLVDAVAMFDAARPAIGYNVYYFVSKMEMNEHVRMLTVGGVEPSTESISDGSYPFVSDFYAVIRKDAPEDSPQRILYNWMQSPDGQNLVSHEGYALPGS